MSCGKQIAEGDQGVTIPYVRQRDIPFASQEPWHIDCFLEELGIKDLNP